MNCIHNEAAVLAEPSAVLDRMFEFAGLMNGYMERSLAERGLTRARATVVWELFHSGSMTQRALSEALGVTPRNVTGLLDALEFGGFVRREAHPTDRRATLVVITEQGRAAATALNAAHRAFADELLGAVAAQELSIFSAVLDDVVHRLRAAAAGGAFDEVEA